MPLKFKKWNLRPAKVDVNAGGCMLFCMLYFTLAIVIYILYSTLKITALEFTTEANRLIIFKTWFINYLQGDGSYSVWIPDKHISFNGKNMLDIDIDSLCIVYSVGSMLMNNVLSFQWSMKEFHTDL